MPCPPPKPQICAGAPGRSQPETLVVFNAGGSSACAAMMGWRHLHTVTHTPANEPVGSATISLVCVIVLGGGWNPPTPPPLHLNLLVTSTEEVCLSV